ncbi:uncharacterized protein N7459_000667, partial [Penicillium hispanicum]|uniref:uncharacterized protein n=1 Tax=Penicillium hispanicum TaxID=1080232 RepID=UPI0025404BC4
YSEPTIEGADPSMDDGRCRLVTHRLPHNVTPSKGFAALLSDSSSTTQFSLLSPQHTHSRSLSLLRDIESRLSLSSTNTAFKGRFRQKAEFMSIENLKTFDPFAEADEDTGETKQSQNYIHIRIQQRNGRKTLTTVQGLPKKFDQKKILKVIKKKFACNGTIVADSEMGEVIQLQGDQRKDVQEFLTDKKEGLELDAKTIKVCLPAVPVYNPPIKPNPSRSMGSNPVTMPCSGPFLPSLCRPVSGGIGSTLCPLPASHASYGRCLRSNYLLSVSIT